MESLDVEPAVISEWGSAVEIGAGGPDDRLDETRRLLAELALRNSAAATAEAHGLTWVHGPEIVAPPFDPLRQRSADAPLMRLVYADYDDDGEGIGEPIGEPIGERWYFVMGWYARGYQRPTVTVEDYKRAVQTTTELR